MTDYERLESIGWILTPVKDKRPLLVAWQQKTVKSIEFPGSDFGVVLGPRSGVIDVECDSPEAYDALLELLEGEVPMTTSWQSARGMHFIFKFTDGWPPKGVFKVRGIEFRIGNDGKGAQSVLPPAGGRQWVNAPWDIEPQEFLWKDKILCAWLEEQQRVKSAVVRMVESCGIESSDGPLDVRRWLDRHGVQVFGEKSDDAGKTWYIECPGIHMHTTPNSVKDCMVCQDRSGRLGGYCFHKSCGMEGWQEISTAIGKPDREDYGDPFTPADSQRIGEMADRLWPSKAVELADEDEDSDEDFCTSMLPQTGLMKMIYDCYLGEAIQPSPIIGLATAVSLCQLLFGRKIASHTGLRVNDYSCILAPTGAGKEAAEGTVSRILGEADPENKYIMPADVQSGNGLMAAMKANPQRIWVCDEFGKILQAILDKKGNQHVKQIATHMLKLYGKSSSFYSGAAHSDGVRNAVHQPHLVLLGMATPGTLYVSIGGDQLVDGFLARLTFWPVYDRPADNPDFHLGEVDRGLVDLVKSWLAFAPNGDLATEFPRPIVMAMTTEAKNRWLKHKHDIKRKMDGESEVRAAIWSRVAARSMKLALVHRAARLSEVEDCKTAIVEMQDVQWAVKLSNWLARIACSIIRETVADMGLERARTILGTALAQNPKVSVRAILRANRTITRGDLAAAAEVIGAKLVTEARGKQFYTPPVG